MISQLQILIKLNSLACIRVIVIKITNFEIASQATRLLSMMVNSRSDMISSDVRKCCQSTHYFPTRQGHEVRLYLPQISMSARSQVSHQQVTRNLQSTARTVTNSDIMSKEKIS